MKKCCQVHFAEGYHLVPQGLFLAICITNNKHPWSHFCNCSWIVMLGPIWSTLQDYPVECAEVEVFHAVLCWLQYDPSRSKHTPTLLPHINFSDIPQRELEHMQGSVLYQAVAGQATSMPVFIRGSRSFGIHKRREVQSRTLGLVNRRGLQASIVNVGGFQTSTGNYHEAVIIIHLMPWITLTYLSFIQE